MRLAFEERHGPADQAFTVCAKRSQRLLLPLIDALDLVGVSGDRGVLVFSEAVHLVAVQSPHVVRLPAMLLLLLRFLTLLALGDRGLCAPPDIRGERMPLVLLCGDSFGLISVFRLAAELPSRTLLFDGGLSILYAPLGFFSEGLLPVFRALPFLLPAAFGDPPLLRFRYLAFRCVSAFICSVLRRSSRFASSFARSASARNSGFSPVAWPLPAASRCLIVIGHGLAPFCRRASACAGGHAWNGDRAGGLDMS